MEVIRIEEDRAKQRIAEGILAALPEWFGIPEARAEYVWESADKIFLCAMEQEEPAGFLYLKETGKDTMEIAAMGVRKEFHRRGVGKALFERQRPSQRKTAIRFFRSRPCKWGNMKAMMPPTGFIKRLGSRNWKCFRLCGTPGTPARSM